MWKKMIEIEELKKELAHAQMAASKARKLDDKYQQVPEVERRVGSLDGCDVDSGFKQLRAQVCSWLCFGSKVVNAWTGGFT
jgi:hypothetical protein